MRLRDFVACALAGALLVALGIAPHEVGAARVQRSDTLTVTYIAHSAFAITDGATTLFVDFPYRPGQPGVDAYDPDAWRPNHVVVCLITHGHYDHFDTTRYLRTPWSLIAPPKLAFGLSRTGHDVMSVSPDEPVDFEGITVEAFATPHDEMEHQSYLVTWHGVRIYVTGDSRIPGPLETVGPVDVVLLNARLAQEMAAEGRRIDGRLVIVCHLPAGTRVDVPEGAIFPEPGQSWRVAASGAQR